MRFLITGDNGFIAKNLIRRLEEKGHSCVHSKSGFLHKLGLNYTPTEEICIHKNTELQWAQYLERENVDIIIHNAAVVGTDVVALNPAEATLTNVQGTYNICRAARKQNIPVCFLGTTVIYDTKQYQSSQITEKSNLAPHTFYGSLKLTGEFIVRSEVKDWMIVRPLFAYGGNGDNNSLIAKSIYAAHNNKNFDIYLSPDKVKDYIYVDDFVDAVILATESGAWGNDYNVAAETPDSARNIVQQISAFTRHDVEKCINWNPETDYLGNHRLSSEKFRRDFPEWKPQVSLQEGIKRAAYSIGFLTTDYNPLKFYEDAKKNGIDLLEHFVK